MSKALVSAIVVPRPSAVPTSNAQTLSRGGSETNACVLVRSCVFCACMREMRIVRAKVWVCVNVRQDFRTGLQDNLLKHILAERLILLGHPGKRSDARAFRICISWGNKPWLSARVCDISCTLNLRGSSLRRGTSLLRLQNGRWEGILGREREHSLQIDTDTATYHDVNQRPNNCTLLAAEIFDAPARFIAVLHVVVGKLYPSHTSRSDHFSRRKEGGGKAGMKTNQS